MSRVYRVYRVYRLRVGIAALDASVAVVVGFAVALSVVLFLCVEKPLLKASKRWIDGWMKV